MTTPAADQSRSLPAVRRRETFLAAAWRLHEVPIVLGSAGIVGGAAGAYVMVATAPPSADVFALVFLGLMGAFVGAPAGALASVGLVFAGHHVATAIVKINASRQYLDDDGDNR